MQYIAVVFQKVTKILESKKQEQKLEQRKRAKLLKIKKIYCVYDVLTCPFVYHSAFFSVSPCSPREYK